jgi:hypothetical protein
MRVLKEHLFVAITVAQLVSDDGFASDEGAEGAPFRRDHNGANNMTPTALLSPSFGRVESGRLNRLSYDLFSIMRGSSTLGLRVSRSSHDLRDVPRGIRLVSSFVSINDSPGYFTIFQLLISYLIYISVPRLNYRFLFNFHLQIC